MRKIYTRKKSEEKLKHGSEICGNTAKKYEKIMLRQTLQDSHRYLSLQYFPLIDINFQQSNLSTSIEIY